ncbi:uncharacterized protein LOC127715121 [Mytilus californianus]|uniref:uncharacterized protein LOC127715121 n=1 Tax=Mytilus californianus TaxID=6549 RepID=UPI00224671CF|nr:uncharacterized protein LOC127715121 [Mytilus californianus]
MSNVAIGNSKYLDCYNFKKFSLDLTNGDLWYGTTKLFSAFTLHFQKITLSTREIGIMTRNGCDGEWIFIGGQNTSSHCDNRRQYITPNVTTTIQQLVQDIRIQDKTVLSAYKRKKICADDSRVTCVSLGCIGSVVIILIGMFIVILDLLPKRVQSE